MFYLDVLSPTVSACSECSCIKYPLCLMHQYGRLSFHSYLINLQKHLSLSLACNYQCGTSASRVTADGWICCQWGLRAIKEALSNDCQGKAAQWTLRFIFAPSQPAAQQWNCTSHLCLICRMSITSLSVAKSHETFDENGTQEMSSALC